MLPPNQSSLQGALTAAPLPSAPLKPGSTVGIVGGGQLGRMLAMAARRLGFRVVILSPDKDCPAAAVADRCIQGDYADSSALAQLAGAVDVATYEFENIPASSARSLSKRVALAPSSFALEIAQNRLSEKRYMRKLGIAVAPYAVVDADGNLHAEPRLLREDSSSAQADGGVEEMFPAIIKTCCFGYDGKGQIPVFSPADVKRALAELGGVNCILEKRVNFEFEVSMIAARTVSGEFANWDVAANVHEEGILRESTVPAKISVELLTQLKHAMMKLMESLQYVGVMAAEFFVCSDSSSAEPVWMLNEIAPRVHNSGHWTIDAAYCSQFEQHIRAITHLPLGDCRFRHEGIDRVAVMRNLLGDEVSQLEQWLAMPSCWVHLYGKSEIKSGRKMAHVTYYRDRKSD